MAQVTIVRSRPSRCVRAAPTSFSLDEKDQLHVLAETVTPERRAQVEQAVRECPKQALSLLATALIFTSFSASTEAHCAIDDGFEVDCDWIVAIALISSAGPPA